MLTLTLTFTLTFTLKKVLTSDNGKVWKLVKSGLNVPQFLFNPVLHTSYIRVDYQDETCDLYVTPNPYPNPSPNPYP